jgi:hypothetical protein
LRSAARWACSRDLQLASTSAVPLGRLEPIGDGRVELRNGVVVQRS